MCITTIKSDHLSITHVENLEFRLRLEIKKANQISFIIFFRVYPVAEKYLVKYNLENWRGCFWPKKTLLSKSGILIAIWSVNKILSLAATFMIHKLIEVFKVWFFDKLNNIDIKINRVIVKNENIIFYESRKLMTNKQLWYSLA